MAANNKLAVCESFYSIQGEGSTMGAPAYFLRLAGCNLMCGGYGTEKDEQLHDGATWRCDSIEVWMKGRSKTFDQILEDLGGDEFILNILLGAHLVITGGEPMLQQKNIILFLSFLKARVGAPFIVEIETNGTIEPDGVLMLQVKHFNVSLKLSNSGMRLVERIKPDVIKKLNEHPGTIFKFVISSANDIAEVLHHAPLFDRKKIWLMPAGSNAHALIDVSDEVVELCKKHVLNFSHRLHIAIWDKKTGV